MVSKPCHALIIEPFLDLAVSFSGGADPRVLGRAIVTNPRASVAEVLSSCLYHAPHLAVLAAVDPRSVLAGRQASLLASNRVRDGLCTHVYVAHAVFIRSDLAQDELAPSYRV